jgi:hypothetical protein
VSEFAREEIEVGGGARMRGSGATKRDEAAAEAVGCASGNKHTDDEDDEEDDAEDDDDDDDDESVDKSEEAYAAGRASEQ